MAGWEQLVVEPFALDSVWVYDQEYRAYCGLYGVPCRWDGWICYWDGRALHVCAFHTTEPDRRFGPADLHGVLSTVPGEPRFVSVWGRLGAGLRAGTPGYRVAQYLDSAGTASADVLQLHAADPPGARRAAARSRAAGLRAERTTAPWEVEHLVVLDGWLETHEVTRLHRVFALECLAAHRAGLLDRWDVRCDGELAGFGITSRPTARDAVYLQGYFRRRPGAGAADAFLDAFLADCRGAGVRRVHMGYSRGDGLRRFKRKWGAEEDPRTRYEQVVLVADGVAVPPSLDPRDAAARAVRWAAETP